MSGIPEQDQERLHQAKKIISTPQDYKVCEGCGSIVISRTDACPSCHAYRFDETEERVVAQAKVLASRQANSVLSSDMV